VPYNPAPWAAQGDGWIIEWSPTPPYLAGTAGAVELTKENLLERNLLTPTGPSVEGDESNPLAVRAALPGDAEFTGSPPPIPGYPEDAVS
jgi:hypothetical protein